MRNISRTVLIALLSLVYFSTGLAGPGPCGRGGGGGCGGCAGVSAAQLDAIPAGTLTAVESDNLIYLREEEKLARDVYLTLGERWTLPIFDHIAGSEQRHMDTVGRLLDRYHLEDPVSHNTRGAFDSATLQELYTTLVTRGEQSLTDALAVGATIEDMDIFDLNRMSEQTEKQDLSLVFETLTQGSNNHIRAYTRQLAFDDVDYAAQYLTEVQLAAILKDDNAPRGGCGRNARAGGRGPGNRSTR